MKYEKQNQLSRCYNEKLSINADKANDIRWLMGKNLIPEKYHEFYKNLLD